ncbi:MAG: methyltransferase domain-containing protein [Polyangiaceae bacterium]|nr:methyltransferase domain-containing protein [Polyangiaceae bacterium]
MHPSFATKSRRETGVHMGRRARIVVAARLDGPLANALRALERDGTAHVAESAAEALEVLSRDEAWVLIAAPRVGAEPGLDLARAATVRDPDLAALVLYDVASLPDVVRTVRAGTNLRFLSRDGDPEHLTQLVRSLLATRREEERRRADRRAFPRTTPAELGVVEPANSALVDITPEGIALYTEQRLRLGGPLGIVLRAGDRTTLRVPAEVLRCAEDPLGRWVVAARFTTVSPTARKVLEHLIRRHLVAQGPREMQRQFREAAGQDVIPIVARDRIAAFLARVSEEQVLASVNTGAGAMSWKAHLQGVDPDRRRFELAVPATVAGIAPGQQLDVLLQYEFESYLFESRLARVALLNLECEFPSVVYYSEKRSRTRLHLQDQALRLGFPHPKGDDTWLEFGVLDVSSTGASFVTDLERVVILPGTLIDPIRLTLGGRAVLSERAEVRHVTLLGEERAFKVGVRFAPTRFSRRAAAGAALGVPDARPAGRAEPAIHQAKVVKFTNSDGEEIVGLLNVTARGIGATGPVVIIPPAWGLSKEAFSAYSLTWIESCARIAQPAAVLRFDYTHHKGESYISPENCSPGREAMDFALSRAVGDILAAVQFCFSTPLFTPSEVVLFGPSFSAPVALRAATLDSRIGHLVCPMGAPNSQEAVKNASGGLDYFGAYQRGVRPGIVDFLGMTVNMDRIAADAVRSRLAFAADAEDDLARLGIPVSWFAGREDRWINPRQVEKLLERGGVDRCELTVLNTGHLPTRDEGLVVAAEVARTVLRRLRLDPLAAVVISPSLLDSIQAAEGDRAPRARVASADGYWRQYLLGKHDDSLGFDVLARSSAYQDFATAQLDLLQLAGGERVLDAGGGTGQLIHHLLSRWQGPLPQSVEVVDLVPEALERARQRLPTARRWGEVEVLLRAVNLESSRLTPVRRFLAGEYHGIAALRGRIRGLRDDVVERLAREYELSTAGRLHSIIRGALVDRTDLDFLDPGLHGPVIDLGRAARLVCGALSAADLRQEYAAESQRLLEGQGRGAVHAGHVAFEVLDFGEAVLPEALDLETATYDRIVCSLVLPYLQNPDETVAELVRALRPGGILVVSTMKPDVDISQLQARLVEDVRTGAVGGAPERSSGELLDEVRAQTGAAAFLFRLTQEGTFRFMTPDDLSRLLVAAGLKDIRFRAAFGQPPQAYAASGRKP